MQVLLAPAEPIKAIRSVVVVAGAVFIVVSKWWARRVRGLILGSLLR